MNGMQWNEWTQLVLNVMDVIDASNCKTKVFIEIRVRLTVMWMMLLMVDASTNIMIIKDVSNWV